MKRLFIMFAVVALSASVFAQSNMPNFYGKVVKEIRYVDQEEKFNMHTFNGAQDVLGSKSRLGAKNTYKLPELNASYNIELGVLSSAVDVRKAKIDLEGMFGTLTLGKDYTAISELFMIFDPLAHTGNGVTGLDVDQDVANVSQNIGFLYRARKELIGYATPVFAGIQFKTTLDQDGDSNSRTKAPTSKRVLDSTLTYNGDMGGVKPTLVLGYSKVLGSYDDSTFSTYKKDNTLVIVAKLGFGDASVGAHYGKKTVEKGTATKKKPEDTYMTISADYKIGKGTLALTYAKHSADAKDLNTDADKKSDSQIAFGYTHKIGDYVSMHLVLASVTHKEELAANETLLGNKATMATFGTAVSF